MTPISESAQQSNGTSKTVGDSPQKAAFNLTDFVTREQRRTDRLVRAAYGVGHTKEWFRAAPRSEQEGYVQVWIDEALDAAAERRARTAANQSTGAN